MPISPPSRPRLVISLTTIPSRIGRIKAVLNSLIDQTVPADDILLAVPGHSRCAKAAATTYRPSWAKARP